MSLDDCIHAYRVGQEGPDLPGVFGLHHCAPGDLTKLSPKEILGAQVLQTFVGERLVYQKR